MKNYITWIKLTISCLMTLYGTAYAGCWKEAENRYRIDAKLLKSIAIVESGMNTSAVNYNKNGTYDIGLMQINSSNFNLLRRVGIEPSELTTNPCKSVMAGATILTLMIREFGYNWQAVGAYNAGVRKGREYDDLRLKYAAKVWKVYQNPEMQ